VEVLIPSVAVTVYVPNEPFKTYEAVKSPEEFVDL
jgi:hypothetical protein